MEIDVNDSGGPCKGVKRLRPDSQHAAEPGEDIFVASPSRLRKYSSQDPRPYLVIISSNDHNLGQLHYLSVGRLLKNVQGLKSVDKCGLNRVRLAFDTAEHANSFLNHPILVERNWTAGIPRTLVETTGVIHGVSSDISEEEILQDIESPQAEVVSVRRMLRYSEGNRIPTEAVVISFKGQLLPTYVYLYHHRFRLKPDTPKVFQCSKCYHLGHLANQCKATHAACANCGQDHETATCRQQIKCLLCSGKHSATARKECQKWQEHREILTVMVRQRISFNAARRLVKKGSPYPKKNPVTNSQLSEGKKSFPPLRPSAGSSRTKKALRTTQDSSANERLSQHNLEMPDETTARDPSQSTSWSQVVRKRPRRNRNDNVSRKQLTSCLGKLLNQIMRLVGADLPEDVVCGLIDSHLSPTVCAEIAESTSNPFAVSDEYDHWASQ